MTTVHTCKQCDKNTGIWLYKISQLPKFITIEQMKTRRELRDNVYT